MIRDLLDAADDRFERQDEMGAYSHNDGQRTSHPVADSGVGVQLVRFRIPRHYLHLLTKRPIATVRSTPSHLQQTVRSMTRASWLR